MITLMTVWSFVKTHHAKITAATSALLLWACVHQQGQLSSCKKSAESKAEVAATQAQSNTNTAKVQTKIKFVYVKGEPCPQVEVDTEAHANSQATQAQNLSATASLGPASGQNGTSGGLWAGLGSFGLDQPYVSLGLQHGSWQAEAQQSFGAWGGKLAYRALSW